MSREALLSKPSISSYSRSSQPGRGESAREGGRVGRENDMGERPRGTKAERGDTTAAIEPVNNSKSRGGLAAGGRRKEGLLSSPQRHLIFAAPPPPNVPSNTGEASLLPLCLHCLRQRQYKQRRNITSRTATIVPPLPLPR